MMSESEARRCRVGGGVGVGVTRARAHARTLGLGLGLHAHARTHAYTRVHTWLVLIPPVAQPNGRVLEDLKPERRKHYTDEAVKNQLHESFSVKTTRQFRFHKGGKVARSSFSVKTTTLSLVPGLNVKVSINTMATTVGQRRR